MTRPIARWPTGQPLLYARLRQKPRQHAPHRRFSSPAAGRTRPLRVAIVGSGPAGFYTATRILKLVNTAAIDMYERLPAPFGLVRYGVAPDHPEACQDRFAEVAALPNFTFVGNVAVGTDIPLASLRRAYDAVVLAHGGSAHDRKLGIPGEDNLRGVLAARDVVAWYNGLPGTAGFEERLGLDESGSEDAVVVGQGNVALDVARMLLAPVGSLRATDTPEHVLAALARSRVRRVRVVGRRGPLQAAFTVRELREMVTLPGPASLAVVAPPALFPPDDAKVPRVPRRLAALMSAHRADDVPATPSCTLQFMLSPVAFRGGGGGRLESVTFARNEYAPSSSTGDAGDLGGGALPARFRPGARVQQMTPHETVDVPAGLALRSIGYRGAPLPGLEAGLGAGFDAARGLVPNSHGRALRPVADGEDASPAEDERAAVAPGVYVAGWLKTGLTGVIARTMDDAFETAEAIAADAARGAIGPNSTSNGNDAAVGGWLALREEAERRGARPVSWPDWLRIDAAERERGAVLGKPREKIVDVREMLAVLDGG